MNWVGLTAGVAGGSAVLAGAFGAHALAAQLVGRAGELWDLASLYHLVHAAVLVGLSAWVSREPNPWLKRAAFFLAVGIVVFSGSLYAMALGSPSVLGAITPLGGISLVLGWGCIALSAWRV